MSNDGKPFDGPREQGVDYFDDIMGDNSTPTIFDTDFGGGGMRHYEQVKWAPNQEGVTVEMSCRACGRGAGIVLTWPELFIVAHAPRSGMLPQDWKRSDVNSAAYPELYCKHCNGLLAPIITADWAMKRVDAALRAGLITPQALASDRQVQALQQMMAQRPQQGAQGVPQFVPPPGSRWGG